MFTPAAFNQRGLGHLPAHLGLVITHIDASEVRAEMPVTPHLLAPNGHQHAGSIVTPADTCAGCGCMANLPEGATGFATIELKSNHLGTARDGTLTCTAPPVHRGRTTQVWDATVKRLETGRTLTLFRCTPMALHPRGREASIRPVRVSTRAR